MADMTAGEWLGAAIVTILWALVILALWWRSRQLRNREPCPRCGQTPCRGTGYSDDGRSYTFTCSLEMSDKTAAEFDAGDDA